jgi:hypothetical protein
MSPLMSALTTHTSNQFREKRKRNETTEKLSVKMRSLERENEIT